MAEKVTFGVKSFAETSIGKLVEKVKGLFGIGAKAGTAFGAGDGSTTFNLPDMRGQFARGVNTTGTGADPNRVLGSTQDDATAVNGLGLNDPGHTHSSAGSFNGGNSGSGNSVPQSTGTTGSSTTGITFTSTDTETRPTNVALNFIIRT